MSTSAISFSASFKVSGWEEAPVQELGGESKLTRAKVSYALTDASSLTSATVAAEYVMAHTGTAQGSEYVGFGRLQGQWEGKTAELVYREVGWYTKEKGSWADVEVVKGMGKGEWAGMQGKGTSKASHAGGLFELQLSSTA